MQVGDLDLPFIVISYFRDTQTGKDRQQKIALLWKHVIGINEVPYPEEIRSWDLTGNAEIITGYGRFWIGDSFEVMSSNWEEYIKWKKLSAGVLNIKSN